MIAELERDYLEANGFEADIVFDGREGEKMAKTGGYDAILLDVMLPGKTGFDVCRELRRSLHLPIIMVTAKKDDIDKIRGLGLGADDYLEKPFSPAELVARVKSHIHIHNLLLDSQEEKEETENEIAYQNLTILPRSRMVYLDEKEINLTEMEYKILVLLMKNPGKIFSVQNIYESIWEAPYLYSSGNTVMVHIRHLREKMSVPTGTSDFIKTVWGVGYKVEE